MLNEAAAKRRERRAAIRRQAAGLNKKKSRVWKPRQRAKKQPRGNPKYGRVPKKTRKSPAVKCPKKVARKQKKC